MILESAYEATLLTSVAIAHRGGSNVVFLTRLGGGAFRNADGWINSAMRRRCRRQPTVLLMFALLVTERLREDYSSSQDRCDETQRSHDDSSRGSKLDRGK